MLRSSMRIYASIVTRIHCRHFVFLFVVIKVASKTKHFIQILVGEFVVHNGQFIWVLVSADHYWPLRTCLCNEDWKMIRLKVLVCISLCLYVCFNHSVVLQCLHWNCMPVSYYQIEDMWRNITLCNLCKVAKWFIQCYSI